MVDSFVPCWKVPVSGYEWHMVSAKGRRFVGDWVLRQPQSSNSEISQTRTINLMELDPELFLKFAEVETTRDGIKGFADQYGLLGLEVRIRAGGSFNGDYGKETKCLSPVNEPLGLWLRQIIKMKQVVILWKACQDGDLETLREYIRWNKSGSKAKLEPLKGSAGIIDTANRQLSRHIHINSRDLPYQLPGTIVQSDLVLPAALFVQDIVEKEFGGGIYPNYIMERNKAKESDIFRVRLRFLPKTLHQALWLQVVAWIEDGMPFKQCLECKRWFCVPHKAPRTRVFYCSDACRVRAFREKQDLARRLAAKGKSIEEIALKLGSTVKTVKRWVTGQKEE